MRQQQRTRDSTRIRLLAGGLTLLACLVMVLCYTQILVPEYSYPEMEKATLGVASWCVGLLIILLPTMHLPLSAIRPSDFAAWILYLNVAVPATIMTLVLSEGDALATLTRVTVIIAAFSVFEFVRKRPLISPQKPLALTTPFTLLLPSTMLLLTGVIWYLAGFRIDLSFVNVYDRRLAANQVVETGSIMGYVIGLMNGCFVPLALVLGIHFRKRLYLLLAAAMTIAIFSFNGTKGSILIPLALIPILFLAQSRYRVGVWMCAAVAGLMAFALAEFVLLGSDIAANFLVRRQFVLPGLLTHLYWDFFSVNQHVLMSDSFLSWLIEPRYDTNVARLIGGEIFGDFECNANANLWASGFAHFGYPGVFGVSIVAAWLMWIVDSLGGSKRFIVASVIAAEMALIWTNGALHTSLLSNGVIGALALLYVFPSQFGVHESAGSAFHSPRWSLTESAGSVSSPH